MPWSGIIATQVPRLAIMGLLTILKGVWTRVHLSAASELRGTQADRYVAHVQRELAKGKRHSTLGNDLKDEAATRQEAQDWLRSLQRYGLKDDDLCVEFGCGSLWAAEPVIAWLPPDKFVGLDVTDAFFRLGLARLGTTLVVEKRPRCLVISAEVLAAIEHEKPDFVFARKVMIHVPVHELADFLARICGLVGPTTTAVLEMPPTEATWQHNKRSWIYCLDDVAARLPSGFAATQGPDAMIVRRQPHAS